MGRRHKPRWQHENGAYTRAHVEWRNRHGRWIRDDGLVGAVVALMWLNELTSVIELGAGIGAYVEALREHDVGALGLDGIEDVEMLSGGKVRHADFTKVVSGELYGAELALSIEVGEHIAKEHQETYVFNVCNLAEKMAVVSWATPNQHGFLHVNPLYPEQVRPLFSECGFCYDEQATNFVRARCSQRGLMRRTQVFRRERA